MSGRFGDTAWPTQASRPLGAIAHTVAKSRSMPIGCSAASREINVGHCFSGNDLPILITSLIISYLKTTGGKGVLPLQLLFRCRVHGSTTQRTLWFNMSLDIGEILLYL